MEVEIFEGQRTGRNKSTQINHAYINGGEYRKKYDNISDSPELNRQLYNLAKQILEHRSGSLYEDMYWLDPETAEIKAKEVDGITEEQIDYSKSTINSNFSHNYILGVICCHDGKVFIYNANELIDEDLYAAYVKKYKLEGKSELDAQWAALESIKENADINFKEVSAYE